MSVYNKYRQDYEVCVVIRAYNSMRFIKEAIESVFNQTYKGKIMIAILYDEGTTDNTLSVLNGIKFAGINREILVIHHPHTSASRSLLFLDRIENEFDYYTFLDYDNFLEPKYLETVLEEFIKDKSDFVFSNLRLVDEYKNKIVDFLTPPKKLKSFPKLILRWNFIDMNTILVNKKTFTKLLNIVKSSIYMNYEWVHEDWIFGVLGIYLYKWKYLNITGVNYRVHGRNVNYGNPNKAFLIQKDINSEFLILQLMWKKISIVSKMRMIIKLILLNIKYLSII